MDSKGQEWAEYCIDRLVALCRTRRNYDNYAGGLTKRLLQAAIFSVYLDCVSAGIPWRAREVLAEWTPSRPGRVLEVSAR